MDHETDSATDNDMPTYAADSTTIVTISFLYSFFNTITVIFLIV